MAVLHVVCRTGPAQQQRVDVAYDDSRIAAGDTLADFRRRADLQSLQPMMTGALFENWEAQGRETIDREDEAAFRLSEMLEAGAKIVFLWSDDYARVIRSGGYVEIVRAGAPAEASSWTTAAELATMTLASLRRQLGGKGAMVASDRFVDQGVPVDGEREEQEPATAIVTGTGTMRQLPIASWRDANDMILLTRWRESLPMIDTVGSGAGAEVRHARELTALSLAEQEQVLRNCGLYPVPYASETCSALRLGGRDIEYGRSRIVHCEKVRVLGSALAREDRVAVSYTREHSQWQSRLVNVSRLKFSLPLLFGLKAKRSQTSENQSLNDGQSVHLAKLLALPKAEVVLEGVSLAQAYLERVRAAVDGSKGEDLVKLLAEEGLFVATHFVLGAMIVGRSSIDLRGAGTRDELATSFDQVISGLVQGRGRQLTGNTRVTALDGRTYDVEVLTIGGSGEASGADPAAAGATAWLQSVATRPQTWRVIGFEAESIAPILEHYPGNLKDRAKALLRNYFENSLSLGKSNPAGGSGGAPWEEREHASLSNRVAGCQILYEQCIDSIRFVYEDRKSRRKKVGTWHGKSRVTEHAFTVRPDDEIVAVEVGWDKTVDHVLFHTRKGDDTGGVMGRARGAKHTQLFQQPRIRGFHGRADHLLDALGVYFYDLSPSLSEMQRSVLLTLEDYLYESLKNG